MSMNRILGVSPSAGLYAVSQPFTSDKPLPYFEPTSSKMLGTSDKSSENLR